MGIETPSNTSLSFKVDQVNSGGVEPILLEEELSQEVASVVQINQDGRNFTVFFAGDALSDEQKTAARKIIRRHRPRVRERKIRELIVATQRLERDGFEFPADSGKRFALDSDAKTLLIGMFAMRDHPALQFPVRWSSVTPGESLEITDPSMLEAFFLAAFAFLREVNDAETALRDRIERATSLEEIRDIRDERKKT